jgi:hypothetical protein
MPTAVFMFMCFFKYMYTQKEPVACTPAWPYPLCGQLYPAYILTLYLGYIRWILILPSHLHQVFTIGFVPLGSGTKILYLLYGLLHVNNSCGSPQTPIPLCHCLPNKVLLKKLCSLQWMAVLCFNLLKTKHNLLYIRNQSVPRCKHFPTRLKKPSVNYV